MDVLRRYYKLRVANCACALGPGRLNAIICVARFMNKTFYFRICLWVVLLTLQLHNICTSMNDVDDESLERYLRSMHDTEFNRLVS